MRALWLEAQALRLREDIPLPVPPSDEALVRVHLAGICNTDLELVRGYYPFEGVPGHEFVGSVVEAASAPEWVGRRVAGEINAACGSCVSCRAGRPTHCEKRTVLGIVARDGAFATHLRLPVRNLHAVPDTLADEAAVFVGDGGRDVDEVDAALEAEPVLGMRHQAAGHGDENGRCGKGAKGHHGVDGPSSGHRSAAATGRPRRSMCATGPSGVSNRT